MPFYEYECSACKFYIEVLQKISDPPLTRCTSCGKEALARLISAPVFRLKGAGWYETDFKSDKEDKRNLAEDKEPATKAEGDDKDAKARPKKAPKKPLKTLKKVSGKAAGKKMPGRKTSRTKAASRSKAVPAKAKQGGKKPNKVGTTGRKPAKQAVRKTAKKTTRTTAKKK